MRNGKAASGLFTWDDYQALPDDDGLRHEVLGGEHVVSPAPNTRHQEILGLLYIALVETIARQKRGKVLLSPFDVKLSHVDVVQPDLIVLLPRSRERLGEKYLDGPPDLAIEILSPRASRRDRIVKKARYAENGIPEYWIVDPVTEAVEQFVLDGDAYRLAGEHRDRIAPAILPEAVIDLRSVFAMD